jgi:hypothetical protein
MGPQGLFTRNIKIHSDSTNLVLGDTKSVGRRKIEPLQFLSSSQICVVRHKIPVSCKRAFTEIPGLLLLLLVRLQEVAADEALAAADHRPAVEVARVVGGGGDDAAEKC